MYWCENKGGRGSTSELIYISCRCEKKGEDKGKMWRRVGLGGTLNMPPQILIKKIFVQLWFFQKKKKLRKIKKRREKCNFLHLYEKKTIK